MGRAGARRSFTTSGRLDCRPAPGSERARTIAGNLRTTKAERRVANAERPPIQAGHLGHRTAGLLAGILECRTNPSRSSAPRAASESGHPEGIYERRTPRWRIIRVRETPDRARP